MVLVVLWVYLDVGLFVRPGAGGRGLRWSLRDGRTLASGAVCLLMSSGGVYYAFFSCYFLLLAGVASCFRRRRARPLAAAGILVALIALGVLANAAPTILYGLRHGPNPYAFTRAPSHPDLLGLKLGHLLLPVTGHRLPALARVKNRYLASLPPGYNENFMATLGLAGSAGFVYLLGRLLVRRPSAGGAPDVRDGLTLLTLFALLLGIVGGLGPLLSVLTQPWIRAYNRVSVFIAFFALSAVALLLERARRALGGARTRFLFPGLLALLLAAGILDQTVRSFVPPYEALKKAYECDAAFVRRVEAAVPAGAPIYQLPFVSFPEGYEIGHTGPYDHFRAYLHSRTLCWSHGGMRGREGDLWNDWVGELPPAELVRALACAGYAGIYFDRGGFPEPGAPVETELARLLGEDRLQSGDGRLAFFSLRPYAERLRRQATAAQWAAWQEAARHPVTVTWRDGFYPAERKGGQTWHRANSAGVLTLNNPSGRPRPVTLSMTCATEAPGPARLDIGSPLWTERVAIDGHDRPLSRTLVVPPGMHPLWFSCADGRIVPKAPEGWPQVFRVMNLTLRPEDP
jgi:phosphoglycerol transferase